MKHIIFLMALLCVGNSFAQKHDAQKLQQLSQVFQQEFDQNQIFINQYAHKTGQDVNKLNNHLVGKFGNFLAYIDVLDADQIKAANVDFLYNNTLPNIAVTGEGMTVYQWDGGRVEATHREYEGRVTNMEEDDVAISDHSTGVAGVIIAQGLNANAKGMAPEANLIAFDYNNNFSELAAESAAATDYMISNHSYGYQAGWRWGEYEESLGEGWYWFGYPSLGENESVLHGIYSNLDGYYDWIARSSPYHLILKAAGNDRNLGPTTPTEHAVLNDDDEWEVSDAVRPVNCGQTGYDCIPYGSVGKNIMMVGSIRQISGSGRYTGPESVEASNFSAFGPTDDGRIKPDLVTQGSSVIIPISNDEYYNNSNGTSVSTPSVSGIALLLQQINHQLTGEYLNSSQLKGLLLNTTNEAGENPGPDYKFGFGLVDAFQAANLLVDKQDNQAVVMTGTKGDNDINVQLVANGDAPIRATMVWLDADIDANALPFELNNRTKVLVNDLDMSITHNEIFTEYLPWTLDVENPAAAAVPGDNVVDNVEQILIESPAAGYYNLQISHKNTLVEGAQDFALIVSGAGLANQATQNIESKDFVIYPNPTQDILNLKGWNGNLKVQVINMDGKIVLYEQIENNQLNVNVLESGAYLIMIESEEGTTAKKFIKK